ncbi:hypothetical protein [Congzhengia minquanensis]|uniref:Uncharacterized protein n=1 Tax=Congzhengia minquanensis TaxID=2763657 RepID=A0A926DLR5_9FIRM|nr:hypothetical protein [Congzhengia minquanensis]MBC8540616.1 hypothetical protein [Congzhengia minquanensis]
MNIIRMLKGSRKQIFQVALLSFIVNSLYALGNFALGIWSKSYWFLTMGAYNLILAIMRVSVVLSNKKNEKNISEIFIQRFIGIMIILLGCILCGSVYLSINFDVAHKFHEIIMITIATYTFTKITLAIINYVKRSKFNSHIISTIRCIALCDATASLYSLQKSMLVSFEGMTVNDIRLMNILTGASVVIIVVVLGVLLIKKSKKEIKNG